MEDNENKERERVEIFSRSVLAGKRTYFFDVKTTTGDEQYLTITESKRRFSNEEGKFFYEKHKIFLYREDFDKFFEGLNAATSFITTGKSPELPATESGDVTHRPLEFEDLTLEQDLS